MSAVGSTGSSVALLTVSLRSHPSLSAFSVCSARDGVIREFDDSSLNVQLTKDLDLFASSVHCFYLPVVVTRQDDVDIVKFGEDGGKKLGNTEGENWGARGDFGSQVRAFGIFGILQGTEENPDFLEDVKSQFSKDSKFIVDLHCGWHIEAISQSCGGSSVQVSLPLKTTLYW
ncbi:hypothetical protein R1sor_003648 [Riccia sorocarpa]|uniref:Uncharacterized protein n=1 Tax=Riccia sorocarpa TaxID=122646 RepID=A0ABD3H3X0_9MARC